MNNIEFERLLVKDVFEASDFHSVTQFAKCVGCGLEINNGILEVATCDGGAITCFQSGNPNCSDGGIDVKLCSSGGLSYDSSCANQFGSSGGLKINASNPIFPPNAGTTPPAALGCGLNTNATGQLIIDIDDTATCGDAVKNLLSCVPGSNGLSVAHQLSIVGNTGICGSLGTVDRAYQFLLPPASQTDMAVATTLSAGTYFWHTDVWLVAPPCTDSSKIWGGNTIFDMGGINFNLAPNSLVRAQTEISQGYVGNAITFGADPLQRSTFDTRGIGVRNEFDYQSHDTATQYVAGGQTLQFQMRLRVEVLAGSVIISSFATVWEANWHYSHVNATNSTGCTN